MLNMERRSSRRYPIRLGLTFKLRRDGKVVGTGAGQSVDISSRGLLFESSGALLTDCRIEIVIAWPELLNQEIELNLCVSARTVRAWDRFTAVSFERYVFRTRSGRRQVPGQDAPQSPPDPGIPKIVLQ